MKDRITAEKGPTFGGRCDDRQGDAEGDAAGAERHVDQEPHDPLRGNVDAVDQGGEREQRSDRDDHLRGRAQDLRSHEGPSGHGRTAQPLELTGLPLRRERHRHRGEGGEHDRVGRQAAREIGLHVDPAAPELHGLVAARREDRVEQDQQDHREDHPEDDDAGRPRGGEERVARL